MSDAYPHSGPGLRGSVVAMTLLLFLALLLPAPALANVPPLPDLVGWMKLSGALHQGPRPFAWIDDANEDPSFEDVMRQMQTVAVNDRYLGLVVSLDGPDLSSIQTRALMQAMQEIRAAGKKVIVFSDQYDTRTYLLASAADKIVLQHRGTVMLMGMAMEEMYLAGLLDKIGVAADLIQIGQFKGADETLMRKGPSPAWDENIDGLLDNLYAQLINTVAGNRGMTVADFEALMAASWHLNDRDLLARGIVDQLAGRDLLTVTPIVFGDNFIWDQDMGRPKRSSLNMDNPFALIGTLFRQPKVTTHRPSIAVIHASGLIHSGDSSADGGFMGSASIGSRTMLEVLGKVRDDENIRGAVIHLDSPGGSALASEVIWQAIREVTQDKPVYVVIGQLAASGGYYIASAADQIYVAPESIVGSIGVVAGKITMGGLYDWAGIHVKRRSRGPLGDMFNSVEPFTPEQRDLLRDAMQLTYEQFTDRVAIGRGNRLTNVQSVSEGRLFAGAQCVTNGMADGIGDLDQTVARLAEELNLAPGTFDRIELPTPVSLAEYLSQMFGVHHNPPVSGQIAPWLRTARELLGAQVFQQVEHQLRGLMLLQHEPIVAIMPTVLVVR